jgi:hypothetical protein
MLDVYSAINAGRVGRYNASDANNGGAPGTVRDKVNSQMAGHRKKAEALLGSEGGEIVVAQAPEGAQPQAPSVRSDDSGERQTPSYMAAYASSPSGNSQGVAYSQYKPLDDGYMASQGAAWGDVELEQLKARREAEEADPREVQRQYMTDIMAAQQKLADAEGQAQGDAIYQAAVQRALQLASIPNSTRRG